MIIRSFLEIKRQESENIYLETHGRKTLNLILAFDDDPVREYTTFAADKNVSNLFFGKNRRENTNY